MSVYILDVIDQIGIIDTVSDINPKLFKEQIYFSSSGTDLLIYNNSDGSGNPFIKLAYSDITYPTSDSLSNLITKLNVIKSNYTSIQPDQTGQNYSSIFLLMGG